MIPLGSNYHKFHVIKSEKNLSIMRFMSESVRVSQSDYFFFFSENLKFYYRFFTMYFILLFLQTSVLLLHFCHNFHTEYKCSISLKMKWLFDHFLSIIIIVDPYFTIEIHR